MKPDVFSVTSVISVVKAFSTSVCCANHDDDRPAAGGGARTRRRRRRRRSRRRSFSRARRGAEPVITAEKATDTSGVRFTEADVRFMQGMIGHHAQALEMTALVADRTTSPDLRKLALRIEISQADEIAMMEAWLTARGQDAAHFANSDLAFRGTHMFIGNFHGFNIYDIENARDPRG
jgi:hypothetical protein